MKSAAAPGLHATCRLEAVLDFVLVSIIWTRATLPNSDNYVASNQV